MRRWTCWLLLLVLAGSGGCGREHGYGWEPYTSAEGRFRILLPGKPIVKTIRENSPAGSFQQHAVVVPLKQGDFQAAYTDLPARPRLDFSTVIQMRAFYQGGKVVEDREVTVAGHKGRGYEIEIDRPQHQLMSGRLFLVNDRLYHLMTTGPTLRASSPEVKKFFDSFQLMP